jgi:hypothetical protein
MMTRSRRGISGPIRPAFLAAAVGAGVLGGAARADIDVKLEPQDSTAAVGETVRFDCYLTSESPHEYCCATIAIEWDPDRLRLIDADDSSAAGSQMAWWPPMNVPWTLNEEIPPQDGNGLYIVMSSFGSDDYADADGTVLTTFEFEALAPGIAEVSLDFEGPGIEDATIVWDGVIPNLEVTGELGSGAVTIGSSSMQSCPADITGDNEVGVDDVLEIFENWQAPYTVDDLVAVLMNFGPCGQ